MKDIEQLACWAFECSRAELYLGDFNSDATKIKKFYKALERLGRGLAVQYITGETEFMGLKFYVSPSVFIPRPETEILVEATLQLIQDEHIELPFLFEIGTGSGAIAVSLTKYNPFCKILASDISKEALEVARANSKLNGVNIRIEFVLADLFFGISERAKFDLIISNPPYIPTDDYNILPSEVKCEPKLALDGGKGGLDFYKVIIPESAKRLKSEGYLILETGFGQAEAIRNLIDWTQAFCKIKILKDYNGIDRVIFAKKRANT